MRYPLFWSVAAACVLLTAPMAFGQETSEQQACLNKLNKDGAAVAKSQGKEHVSCLKKAGKGLVTGTVQACLTADPKGKVQKKKDKTVADQAGSCGTAPDFGYTSAGAVNTGAVQGQLDIAADIFGDPIDGAVIDCATDKPGCTCQQKVLKDVEKLAATKLGEFVKCKKQGLKDGATSASSLEDCVANSGTPGSIAADSKGKIGKAFTKLTGDIGSKCASVSGAFPADCTSLSGNALATCLDRVVECRVCQTINDMDGLFVNCDLFDDGLANATCASGAGPTPTATDTPTPANTPTATNTATPGTFAGALLKTFGRFTYAAQLGVPGANTECNSNFTGTHACSFPELLTAEGAGELVGIKDVGNNTVTSFWAIDSSHSNLIQCGVSVPWDYMTAHTGHQGELASLTNGTGDLSAPVTGLNCLGQAWVGCCN